MELTGIGLLTVYEWGRAGLLPRFTIPGTRTVRFRRADVEAWMAGAPLERRKSSAKSTA